MKMRTVLTKKWGDTEIVTSPFEGKVIDINVQENDKIYDHQLISIIKRNNGKSEKIFTRTNGIVKSVNINLKQGIVRGEVLITIQEVDSEFM